MSLGKLLVVEGTPFDWVVGGLILALFCWLIVLSLRRPQRKRLVFRCIMSGVACVALLLMAWQPRSQSIHGSVDAMLVTPGAVPSRVARLADSLGIGKRIFAVPQVEVLAGLDARVVPDVSYLVREHPEISTLHVVGNGLAAYDLDALKSITVKAYVPPLETGIQFIDMPRVLKHGQPLRLQGQVYTELTDEATLYLKGPGGLVDSVRLASTGLMSFSVEDVPKETGLHLYHLVLRAPSGDTLQWEPVGVSVEKAAIQRILVLQGTPRFDTRHLKDWISGEGGSLAIRTTISRDRYHTEFLNQASVDLRSLTPSVLALFDVLMLDARSFSQLSIRERRAVQRAVEEEGLGVLLHPDVLTRIDGGSVTRDPTGIRGGFDTRSLDAGEERRVLLSWEHTTLASSIPAAPYTLEAAWGIEPLMTDEEGRWVAAMRRQGVGWIGVSLASETYRWVLEGNGSMHAAYWSHLLSRLSRPSSASGRWGIDEHGPVIHHRPVSLSLLTREPSPYGIIETPSAVVDTIYLAQDQLESTRWRGTYWPREAGWHRVGMRNGEEAGTPFWFFVHDAAAWKTVQAAQKVRHTSRFSEREAADIEGRERNDAVRSVPVPLYWFFLAFLASCAALWFESKL
ncbi:MAG: hypothetical protein ACE5G0_13065 [Rhodothermales bacterium]